MAASRRVVGATLVATFLVGVTAPAGAHAGGAPGRVVIIQAVPKASLDVTVDGRPVRRGTSVGDVLGPLTVSPGRHRIGFSDPSDDLRLHPFRVPRPQADTAAHPVPAHGPWLPVGGGMLLGAGIVLVVRRRRGAPIRSG